MGPVNVVREDPQQPGLLFAGTEREVYFSIDDGDHWQSLRMNMPASSVRDLVVHENDLVVGTHGRSIWILDDIAPLRELADAMRSPGAFLFTPSMATRVRGNVFYDTPLPPEEPAGENPPEGAILDYHLPQAAGTVVLDILDAAGNLVRRYSSDDAPETLDTIAWYYPTYWLRPPSTLATTPGHHRFVWDLRWPPPPGSVRELSIAAVHRDTPTSPRGPFVHPGTYRVRLTVDGVSMERTLDVRLDPRVAISEEDLRLQTELSMACHRDYLRAQALREAIDGAVAAGVSAQRRTALNALRGVGSPGAGDVLYGSIAEVAAEEETVVGLQEKLLFMLELLQGADARPTTQAVDAVRRLGEVLPALERRWAALR